MFRKEETPQPIEEIRKEVRHLVGVSMLAVRSREGSRIGGDVGCLGVSMVSAEKRPELTPREPVSRRRAR